MANNFDFSIEDFLDDSSWAKKTSGHQLNGRAPLRTSGSVDGDPQIGVTTLSISDIMQGAALYKPQEAVLNQFNQTLSTDLSGLLNFGGGDKQVLGEGRASLLPFDIMLKKGFSDGTFDKPAGFNDGTMRGRFNSAATGAIGQFLAYAADEIGYTEEGGNRNKFAAEAGHANGQAWCATFVVAIVNRAGVKLYSTSAYTPAMADGFRAANAFYTTPQVGDIVFFDFPNDSVHRIQHVGIVESVKSNSSIVTIEGNTSAGSGSQDNGGAVARKNRSLNTVVGFGRPAFKTRTASADSLERQNA